MHALWGSIDTVIAAGVALQQNAQKREHLVAIVVYHEDFGITFS